MRPTDGGWSDTSDRRLKKNIQNLETVLDKVLKIRPARYQMIDNNPNGMESIGFIAQELKEVFPELVDIRASSTSNAKTNEITDLHGVNYSHLSVIAIKAIQEQQELIQKLEAQNKELLQMYAQLAQEMETLKKRK